VETRMYPIACMVSPYGDCPLDDRIVSGYRRM
jgi:hypothetical protein